VKIGLFTDGLQDLSLEAALGWVADHGIEAVELGSGNFSPALHCDLQRLLAEPEARRQLLETIRAHGLVLSALNCNGNVLDPHPGRKKRSQETFSKTIELAALLGLDTIVAMSGCPGEPGAVYPNWVTCSWQAEFVDLLERQWAAEVEPFWQKAGQFAAERGVRIAIEMHPGQAVYNTRTLLRLRQIAGPAVGVNLDPSHLFWQGMEPRVVIRALGRNVIFHVHAKDTKIEPQEMALNGSLETRPNSAIGLRSWDFRTVGYGHGEEWWRDFVSVLRSVGYDGVLSIEHEDRFMGSREGIIKTVEFLKRVTLTTVAEDWIP
jgi:sugar phosphate isomerase/epimerase